MNGSEQLRACELDVDDLAERAGQWNALASHVRRSNRTAEGFEVVYSPEAKPTLEALVSAEQVCCSWATWSCHDGQVEVVLEVTGPQPEIDALASAFGA
jgi:hypothetical protein